jgi:hypothetical protein
MRIFLTGLCAAILATQISTTFAGLPDGSGSVTFKVNGETVSTDVWNFAKFTSEGDYNFTTNMHKDKRTILLNLSAPQAGVPIVLGPPGSGSYGSFFKKFGEYSTTCTVESGTVTLTLFDPIAGMAGGTFSLKARSAEGKVFEITDGVFKDGKIGKDQIIE